MLCHSFFGMRDTSQSNYINMRKINALAKPVLFLTRTCQNSSSKCILSHNHIQFMGGTTLSSLVWCRDEHSSLQDLHHIQNLIPEIECFGMKRRERHAYGTVWRLYLQGGIGIPQKSSTRGHELKAVFKAVLVCVG